jgi:hypothetical protein
MNIKKQKCICGHEDAIELLPNIFECRSCGVFFLKNGNYALHISDDNDPQVSVIDIGPAGIVAKRIQTSGSLIDITKLGLTRSNLDKRISALNSLNKVQKIRVIDKLSNYGLGD